ncbi:hypothetical protein CASFOL_024016 [Castilleja foliolosa]|uniref:Uncharacterized protein n=1 Tax=Castilleja foliolosa TaxID=1961234 RepID=A0ABD3CN73_9LAMI
MEEGWGRKRKAGGKLELDWDILLGDNEPPPVVVIEETKSKPRALTLGEDEESHKDRYLQGLTDRELADKIYRAQNLMGISSKLPDGGTKMLVQLKRQIAERDRRKLLKADDKCKKATLLADKPFRIDATDDLASRGAPTSMPASQSLFALSFCSKLDNNLEGGYLITNPLFKQRPAKSFTSEMSTLNRCDYKRENRKFVDLGTKQIGLSSRQAPFKSPNHLSVHTNDSSQSNRGHFRRHSSTASPRQPNKSVSGYFEIKENALRAPQPMRSSKMNNRPFVLVDEDELEVDAVNQGDQVGHRR